MFIPGSPVMTLPELLMHAEEGLERTETAVHKTPIKGLSPLGLGVHSRHRDPFETPAPVLRGGSSVSFGARKDEPTTSREWNKDDWRLLDACFTDERLDVAERTGSGNDMIAGVDDVKVEDVVARFVEMTGGSRVVDGWGCDWDR